jgi:hypothetical protein
MNYENFENICQMSQKELKDHVATELIKTHNNVYVGDGYVYAQGTFPVLLVAHLDTVHKKLPNMILYDFVNDAYSSPNGIGGDDRCGVYMIFEVIKKFNCSVLFCEDEEIGGIGAHKFIETDLAKELKFNYAIEFDRKGSHDAVFYDCDNPDFEDFITEEFYDTAYGSYSDISTLAPFLKCAAVNLSCGYHNAHTESEYVVAKEMDASIEAACKILKRTTEEDKFEYIEAKHSYGGYYSGYYYGKQKYGYSKKSYSYGKSYGYDSYDEYDDVFTNYYLIEYNDVNGKPNWWETYAISEAEAVGRFLMWHPTLCYANIIDVMADKTY